MQLTFKSGTFQLVKDDGTLEALSIKAALKFRHVADQVAKRVFKRTLSIDYKLPLRAPPDFLDPHQKEGVRHILSRSRSYLAHAPGAGKTAQAIIASQFAASTNGCNQTLFIVPPTLTLNWAREILKWTAWCNSWPSIFIVPTSDLQSNCDWRADYILCPDSMLTKEWVYTKLSTINPKLLAVDEASRFKEPTAERTKALFGGRGKTMTYHGLIQNAQYAVLMDGSPMPNRPMELWAPVTAMDPEVIGFMTQHEFGVRYCGGRFIADGYKLDWDYSGASHQDELRTRLQKSFMHVVPERDLKHPERRRSLLYIDDVRTPKLKKWEDANLRKLNLKDIDEDASLGDIARHRQELGERKVELAADYIRSKLEGNSESILVFAWHRSVCRLLENRLNGYRPRVVTGGTSNQEREDIFRSFQNGNCRIIIGNVQAMGRGHNLQRASRVVFAEFSWTDELNKQCEKRASRKGSAHDFVRCDYLVVANSMDEVVLNAVMVKAENVRKVIG